MRRFIIAIAALAEVWRKILFPAFRRLERDRLINAEWRETENNRRAKYYVLTASGRARLKRETREWETQTAAIARTLE